MQIFNIARTSKSIDLRKNISFTDIKIILFFEFHKKKIALDFFTKIVFKKFNFKMYFDIVCCNYYINKFLDIEDKYLPQCRNKFLPRSNYININHINLQQSTLYTKTSKTQPL